MQRFVGLLAATAATAAATGCGAQAKPLPLAHWFSSTSAQRSVTITLIPAYTGAYAGFNFNGYGKGQVEVVVPVGWRVRIRCRNTGAVRHSCAIVPSPGFSSPSIHGASTPHPKAGLQPGRAASFSFVAGAPGVYRMTSLIPGDEVGGMWDVLEIGRVSRPKVILLRGTAVSSATPALRTV